MGRGLPGRGHHEHLKREPAPVDPTIFVDNKSLSRELIALARRAISRAKALCDTIHDRRRRTDFSQRAAKYSEWFPRMRRYIPIAGGDGDPLQIETEEIQGAELVRLAGEVDLGNVGRLKSAMEPALNSGRSLILDVSRLRYVDSTGLHAIIDAHQALQQADCQLVVVGASAGIAKVMRILHLDRLIPMASSVDEAKSLIRTRSSPAANG